MLWHQTWNESVKNQDPNTGDRNNSGITCNKYITLQRLGVEEKGQSHGSIQINQATYRVFTCSIH